MDGQRKKKPKLKAAQPTEASADRPTEEAIRIRAYERYAGRDPSQGDALADWLAAERDALNS